MLCVHPCHTWRRVCFMVAYFCIIKMKTKKHWASHSQARVSQKDEEGRVCVVCVCVSDFS